MDAIHEWSPDHRKFVCIRSAGVRLSSEYNGNENALDESLCQIGKQFPLISVEDAICDLRDYKEGV
uniref:Uncharacterized protein n=1 Tax=Coccidioides posadasii RMSCC 3488 TaxID=454284 RepID=A0A0J6FTB4_COCPO|nr:hypothetical protein CPAG_09880 [Coccidioides posadasii RMSCC 3488]